MSDGQGGTPNRQPADADFTVAIGARRFDPLETVDRLPAPEREGAATARPAGPPDTRLVQFVRKLSPADIARLRQTYDLALTAYIPNHAYVERVHPTVQAELAADPLVRAVAPYLPEYKLSPLIYGSSAEKHEEAGETGLLLDASLFDRGDVATVVTTLEDMGAGSIRIIDDRDLGGLARIRFVVDEGTDLDPLTALDDVRYVEPVARQKSDNVKAASSIQSGDDDNAAIWDRGLHGEDQIINVMDGGPLDIDHCFFDDAPPNNPGGGHRKVVDVRNASGTAADDHATFVAGCAAGDERGNSGGHDRRGGAWAAKLVSTNRLDLSGTSLLSELTAARDSGAFIHTNSWHNDTAGAGNPATYNQNAEDVDTFTFNNEDHLVLGSAGNSGEEQGPPGTAKNAICVAAAKSGGDLMELGDGNPGPTADGRRKPDLATVGCNIESATVSTACDTGPRSTCATSYATPHAAAAATLIRQYFLEGWYPTGIKTAANAFTPTGALLKAVLIVSTVDMTDEPGYPNMDEGWGLVRLNRALFFEGSARQINVFDVRHAAGPSTGDTRSHKVTVADDTEQLKIAMVFTDAPGTSGAADPVINDLDLIVTAPDGTEYRGNEFTGTTSTADPGDNGDDLNNVEVVVVNNPPTGDWTIEVEATQVAVGNPGQGYAVAIATRLDSDCFMTTAVYGDQDHLDVEIIRAWRNRNRARPGMRLLQSAYERIGPRAARVVAHRPRLRRALRVAVFAPMARVLGRSILGPAAGGGDR